MTAPTPMHLPRDMPVPDQPSSPRPDPRFTSRSKARWDRQRGTAAAELAVALPLLILLVAGVVLLGRLGSAEAKVTAAARDAVRAAALRRTPAGAIAAAQETTAANLAGSGLACQTLTVAVNTGQFAPGGRVSVAVTCVVPLAALSMPGVPGQVTRTATAAAPIDVFRGDPLP